MDNKLSERVDKVVDNIDIYTEEMLTNLFGANKFVQKDCIATFFRTEYLTLYPDLRDKDSIGTKVPHDELQGKIKIKRAKMNNSEDFDQLEFCPYEEFMKMIENQDSSVLNYFSMHVDEETGDMMLVVANKKIIDVVKQSNDDEITSSWPESGFKAKNGENANEKAEESHSEYYYSVELAYQNLVCSYAMPFQLLWSLQSVCRDVDFVMNLAHLVEDMSKETIITVQDNEEIVVYKESEDYSREQYNNIGKNNNGEETDDGHVTIGAQCKKPKTTMNPDYIGKGKSDIKVKEGLYNYTTTTTKTYTPFIDVTYADSWLIEYNNTYNYIPSSPVETGGIPSEAVDEEFICEESISGKSELAGIDGMEAIENEFKNSEELKQFKGMCSESLYTSIADEVASDPEFAESSPEDKEKEIKRRWYEQMNNENWITWNIKEIIYSVMKRRTNLVITNDRTITNNLFVAGIPTVREKIEESPVNGEENFVTLINKSKYAKQNLKTAPKWLFEFLKSHSTTANMVDVMKWIIGVSTGNAELQGIEVDWLALIANPDAQGYLNFGGSGYLWGGSVGRNTVILSSV